MPLPQPNPQGQRLQLVNEQLGERPVKGIIITHSHADHFAGILGIFNVEEPATKESQL